MPPIPVEKTIAPIVIEPTMPADPALRGVIEDVLAKLRYTFAAAAADAAPTAPGELDTLFRTFLATRSAPARTRAQQQAHALHAAPAPLRAAAFGRYAAIDLQSYRTMGADGLASHVGKLSVESVALQKSLDQLRAHLGNLGQPLPHLAPDQHGNVDTPMHPLGVQLDSDHVAGLAFKKMRLFIRRVRCVEETSEWGSDEINIGGSATTPNGTTSMINQFEVSDDFDEGELVDFGMNKVFATWNLVTAPAGFPYVYGAVIAMAEKDDGGFYQFLKNLWAKVDSEVKTAIAGLIGAAIGGAIGNVLGAIAGAIVGVIIGWIINLFDNKDDIIGAKPVLITLPSSRKSYYDGAELTSPQGRPYTLNFKGDGGHYRVAVSFKVFTQ
jgi:hypothetical protein